MADRGSFRSQAKWPGSETLEGSVFDIKFRNPEKSFAVIDLRLSDGTFKVCVGPIGHVEVGDVVKLFGEHEDHKSFGVRFRVRKAESKLPTTPEGIVRLLGSGIVPGVGPDLAQRIVDRFGERSLDIIRSESGRLVEVDGIGPKRAQLMHHAVKERQSQLTSLVYLSSLQLSSGQVQRLINRFGPEVATLVQEDPYWLAAHADGFGFRRADQIASQTGISANDPRRTKAGVLYALETAIGRGDCFLHSAELTQLVANLLLPEPDLEFSESPSVPTALARQVDVGLTALVSESLVHIDGDRVYLRPLFLAETECASWVRSRLNQNKTSNDGRPKVDQPTALSEEQNRAIALALTAPMSILTGGPGTGKTTTLKELVARAKAAGETVRLAAPTGRAAKRMSEATGTPASTIHRLLEYSGHGYSFARSRLNPIEADLLIVDESSMLDVRLANALFSALLPGTRVLLVGDPDQLPPIAPGAVLSELLSLPSVPRVSLKQRFRQQEGSSDLADATVNGVLLAADAILSGVPPESAYEGSAGSYFEVPLIRDASDSEKVVRITERLVAKFELGGAASLIVMSPTRRGPLGTIVLNERLQKFWNPNGKVIEGTPFRLGDRIMQLENDYERDVFNGDIGQIESQLDDKCVISFDGRRIEYPKAQLLSFDLAYAVTVHKAQGSEATAIILVLDRQSVSWTSKTLVYTAVTRAKKVAVIACAPKVLHHATSRTLKMRNCALAERVETATP